MRGQIGNLNPGQDQETAVGGQLTKVLLSLPRRPADKAVPYGQFQCRCAPRQGGYRPIVQKSKVLEPMSQKSPIPQVMMPADELIPQRLPACAADRRDGGLAEIVQPSDNWFRFDDSRNRWQDIVWFWGWMHSSREVVVIRAQIRSSGKNHFQTDACTMRNAVTPISRPVIWMHTPFLV